MADDLMERIPTSELVRRGAEAIAMTRALYDGTPSDEVLARSVIDELDVENTLHRLRLLIALLPEDH